jgi:rSAM/selenodomain-associated transferase 1
MLFVKAPRAGQVKTRLGPELDPAQAAAIYRAMVEDLLARLDLRTGLGTGLGANPGADPGVGIDVSLYHDPPDAGPAISDWLGANRLLHPQTPGDLGDRLRGAFTWAFARGYGRVLVAGTDAPALGPAGVAEALRGLDEHDLVIAPSPDGGYSLLGLREDHPGLFRDIPWSTPAVLATTRARATDLGLSTRMLPELPDIDTFADLEHNWLTDGPRLSQGAPRTTAILQPLLAQRERTSHERA